MARYDLHCVESAVKLQPTNQPDTNKRSRFRLIKRLMKWQCKPISSVYDCGNRRVTATLGFKGGRQRAPFTPVVGSGDSSQTVMRKKYVGTLLLGPRTLIIPKGIMIGSAVFVWVQHDVLYNAVLKAKKTPEIAPSTWDFDAMPVE